MNYAFCEVCSLFPPLEWPFLQPNIPRLSDSPTHFRLLSFECFLLAVFIHTLCYLGYIHEGDSHVQLQDPLCIEITKLSFSYSWDVLNFLSALKCSSRLFLTLALINASIFAFSLVFLFFSKDVVFKKHYNDSPEVLVCANHTTSGGNLNPLYNSISAWAEVRSYFKMKEQFFQSISVINFHFNCFLNTVFTLWCSKWVMWVYGLPCTLLWGWSSQFSLITACVFSLSVHKQDRF